jgi:hypothetical protein
MISSDDKITVNIITEPDSALLMIFGVMILGAGHIKR